MADYIYAEIKTKHPVLARMIDNPAPHGMKNLHRLMGENFIPVFDTVYACSLYATHEEAARYAMRVIQASYDKAKEQVFGRTKIKQDIKAFFVNCGRSCMHPAFKVEEKVFDHATRIIHKYVRTGTLKFE